MLPSLVNLNHQLASAFVPVVDPVLARSNTELVLRLVDVITFQDSELTSYLNPNSSYASILSKRSASKVDENDVVIAKPHELGVLETSKNSMDVCINEWLYGCDAEEVLISQKNIITHSEASMTMKNFYSKCVLKTKIHQMVSDLNPKSKSVNPMNIFESLLNGLEQQDSRRDDYIGWDGHPKPWPPEEDI